MSCNVTIFDLSIRNKLKTTNMKPYISFLIKELGINKYLAIKAIYLKHSDNSFSLYKSIKMAMYYKHTKEDVLYRLHWEFSTIKDFAQFV